MAQAGYTPIQLYHSTTAAAVPTAGNLLAGELAINTNDGKLYYEDSGGVVQVIATKAGASGDVVGPASATDNAIVRFDLTTGKLVQNSGVTVDDSNNVTLPAQADLRFADSDSSNWVAFQAPATVASNVTWTLPAADGTANQVLVTDGSGTLSWATAATGNVTAVGNNAFTGANTFFNATGQTFAQATANDGIVLQGRAGGSASYRTTFTTTTLSASRTVTLPDANIDFSTGLGVAQGGTGATTLTANNVILGNGTSAVQFVAPGSSGNVLTSNGTTWQSTTPAATGASKGQAIAFAMIFGL